MRALLCFATVLVLRAQTASALQCVANAGVPPIVRSEGLTELVGDLLLQCTGGSPTPAGVQVPTSNVTITLNTGLTSRLLPDGTSEALLLFDEPKANAQLGCVTVSGPCNTLGTGNGVSTYNGTAGHPSIFQGAQNGPNSVTFYGVPLDPPGTNSTRIIRATNIRANANQLSAAGALSVPITGSISFSNLNIPPVTLATTQPGVLLGTPVTGSLNWCPSENGGQIVTASGGPGTFSVYIGEGFAQSFKMATSEGGFVPNKSAGFTTNIGGTDSGTLLQTTFTHIPAGVSLIAPLNGNLLDSNGFVGGTYATTSPRGTASGNTLIGTPDSTGTISFTYDVLERLITNPNPLSLTVPFTVGGTPSGLQTPLNFVATAGFANSLFPQTTLFAPGSSLLNLIPSYNPLDSGVSNPALTPNFYMGTVIGGCTGTTSALGIPDANTSAGTLNTTGAPSPTFIEVIGPSAGPSLIAPRISNVGIVSALNATPGVTVAANPPAPWLNVNLSGTTTPLTAFLSVNKAAVGNYSTSLNFSGPGGLTLSVPVTYTVTNGPWFTRYGFANSASYVSDVVAPGEPFVIFGGDAFGPSTLAGPSLDANGLVTTMIGNTQVLFDGTPAPLYYSVNANGIGQIAGFAPFELATKTSTNVQVVYNGVTSPPVMLYVLDAVPGLYTADSSGGGQGAILNHDLTINGAGNPESPGNLIVLYGGGAGQTSPVGRDGGLAGVGAPLAQLKLPVKVFIDGIAATNVQYAGPAPGLVEGVFQINVVIPAGVRHNANVPVVVEVEDKQTQPGVTVATK